MINWRQILFGGPGGAATHPPGDTPAPSGGNGGGEAVYAHAPETELRSSQQHKWLFDDGVLHWNQHRRDKDFKPNFSGLNFVKEAAKTRLFGRPVDLMGEERVMLGGVDFSYGEMQGCTLARADLRQAKLVGADLRNANLAGALLNGAEMTDCDLRGANLEGAQLARVKLGHANLSTANLKNANFAWSDLSYAVFGARNLSEAKTFGAIRDGAKFERRYPAPAPWPYPRALLSPQGDVHVV